MRNKNLKTALSKMNQLEQMRSGMEEVSVLTTLSANAIRGGTEPVKCDGTFTCSSFSCSNFSCAGTFSTAKEVEA